MSAPRYTITLHAGGERITRKLKTVLGDHAGLEAELGLMLEHGELVDLARAIEARSGGIESLRGAWWRAQVEELSGAWREEVMKNKHIGSSFDDFLRDEGILEEINAALPVPAPGHGFCDGCGGEVMQSDLEPVSSANLAGVVLCQACKKR
jgi:hypothetical protein